jgi:hypothetical protein
MSCELLAVIRASATRNARGFRPVTGASRLGNILGNNCRRVLPKLAVSALLRLANEQFRSSVTVGNDGWASTLNPQVLGSNPRGRTSFGQVEGMVGDLAGISVWLTAQGG